MNNHDHEIPTSRVRLLGPTSSLQVGRETAVTMARFAHTLFQLTWVELEHSSGWRRGFYAIWRPPIRCGGFVAQLFRGMRRAHEDRRSAVQRLAGGSKTICGHVNRVNHGTAESLEGVGYDWSS